MPTVFWKNGYRFFFVSFDCNEPMHIHVIYNEKECKYWLINETNVALADNYNFNNTQLNFVRKSIIDNYSLIKKVWNEHCKNYKKQSNG